MKIGTKRVKKFTPKQVLINPDKPCLRIWTDGSCLKNPGGAGTYAFVITEEDKMIHEYGEHYTSTTSNRMEILAVMNAIEYISTIDIEQVVIYTDSTYVYNGVLKRVGKDANKNGDLWGRMKILVEANPHIQYMWTEGHAGKKWNEHADKLCTKIYKKTPIEDKGYIVPNTNGYINITSAKMFLLHKYLPTASDEDRELWFKCSDWAQQVVKIMEEYKTS